MLVSDRNGREKLCDLSMIKIKQSKSLEREMHHTFSVTSDGKGQGKVAHFLYIFPRDRTGSCKDNEERDANGNANLKGQKWV